VCATVADVESAAPSSDDPIGAVYNVDITSAGYYSNLTCGTGSVAGTARVGGPGATVPANDVGRTSPPGYPSGPTAEFVPTTARDYSTVGFGIDFVGGVGRLGGGAVGPVDSADNPDASYVTGTVQITPEPPPPGGTPPPAGCVPPTAATGFQVSGAFVTT
jgi:hypothetical protein